MKSLITGSNSSYNLKLTNFLSPVLTGVRNKGVLLIKIMAIINGRGERIGYRI